MADKWTHDLKGLDPVQTRKRLADLIFECHYVADGLEIPQGEGLRDHVSITKLRLEKVAKEEITRLSGMLAEYRSGPPTAPPPYDPYAAARERAAAKVAAAAEDVPATEPEPAPAEQTRPTLPVRGARLPRLMPGRPA